MPTKPVRTWPIFCGIGNTAPDIGHRRNHLRSYPTLKCEGTPPKHRRGPITNNRRENYFIIAFLNIRSTFTLASSAF